MFDTHWFMVSETELTNPADGGQGRPEDGTSGDSDLNSLLAEYEEETKPKAAPPTTETRVVKPDLSKLDPVIKFAEAAMRQTQADEVEKGVNAAVDKVAEGEALGKLPKSMVRRMLIAQAVDNADFDAAFKNRTDNPAAWDAALTGAAAMLAEEIKDLPLNTEEDPGKERDDIEAAVAAVADAGEPGNTDDGPSVTDLISMNDTDFNRLMAAEVAKAEQ